MQPTRALTSARRYQAVSMVLVALASLSISRQAALAAACGGALMALHITLIMIVARFAMAQHARGQVAAAASLFFVKFVVMASLITLTILVMQPHALGFVAGMATLIPAMVGAFLGHHKSHPTRHLCAPRF